MTLVKTESELSSLDSDYHLRLLIQHNTIGKCCVCDTDTQVERTIETGERRRVFFIILAPLSVHTSKATHGERDDDRHPLLMTRRHEPATHRTLSPYYIDEQEGDRRPNDR